jgi:hypothetical protein
MSKTRGEITTIGCRAARKQFAALIEQTEAPSIASGRAALRTDERAIIEHHVQTCAACAAEYRLLALSRATLDVAAAEPFAPDQDFFRGLRARLARGESPVTVERADESWAAALLLTARQLLPAMAMLLLLIIGATMVWNSPRLAGQDGASIASQPPPRRDRIDLFDDPAPIAEDVLDTLVAAEEKKNGK